MTDKRIYYKLNMARHLLSKRVDSILEKRLGIKSVQVGAIFFLLTNDGCMLGELSAGLNLNNSAITGLVSRMEKAGLLKKVPCSVDGRSFRLFLTKKAKQIGKKAFPLMTQFNQRLYSGFTETELEVVNRFLDSAIKLAKEKDDE